MNSENQLSVNQSSETQKDKTPVLLQIFFVFFKLGSIMFGGGLAMLPLLERELIVKRNWTTHEELLDYYAISQSTPGIIAVNVATFIGYKKAKFPGALVATLSLLITPVILITLIALFISNFESIAWVQKALRGINISVAALLTYSVIKMGKKVLKSFYSVALYFASFTAVYFFKVNPVFITLFCIVLGVLCFFISSRNLKKQNEHNKKESE